MGTQGHSSHGRPIRVLVADNQALYREGLREMIGHWHEFEVVGEAANGLEAVQFCRICACDVVLMDATMPVMDGIEATRAIVSENPGVAVVVLAVSVEEENLIKAFRSGARGFVLKETSSRQLRSYLQDAARGHVVVSGLAADKIVGWVAARPSSHFQKSKESADIVLSDDERDIIKLVVQGYSNEEIGARLYISPGSVKKRLRSIMEKLSLDNRVQVAVYAVRHGITQADTGEVGNG